MGEITEDILNGLLCEVCGSYMEDFKETGYPRKCEDCCMPLENKTKERRLP